MMNRTNKLINPITALYCRLSMEDGRDNESMSITNQKAMLKEYAEKNGMLNHAFYVDDGYTGRNFNRPSFQKMVADIEAGKVNCVITKDLSRLGRNYIESGSYIEIFFPRHGVRYIAISDGVDSLNKQEMDITPFRNILNDMFSRDISKKVLAGRMARSRQGKFGGGPAPYGYMRDPADNGHLIIDLETAPTVKLIYDLALDGCGTMKIAKQLLERKIPITRCRTAKTDVNYYSWSGSVISKILRNPLYYGAHVVCKTHQKAIRSNTYNFVPRDEWEVIDNCHEAIITKEHFDRVQKLIDRRPAIMQGNTCPFYNIFHGLMECETCGKSLQPRYEKVGRTGINRTTKEERQPIDKAYYICQTYNRLGKDTCTSHKIEARDLYNVVLEDIRQHADKVLNDSEGFYAKLARKLEKQHTADEGTLKKELVTLTERTQEIDRLFMSLYEDKAKGILTEQRFVMMTNQLEQEQNGGKVRIQEITEELSITDDTGKDIRIFIDEIGQYAAITELDEVIVHRLIHKIVVGEKQVVGGEKIQRVRIVYNFVGELGE